MKFVTILAISALASLSAVPSSAQLLPPSSANENPSMDITLTSLTPTQSEPGNNDIPFDALRTFVDVFDTIKKNYVVPVSNQTIVEDAVRGMLGRLDPHSSFMDDEQYHDFEEQTDGDYAGIGVVLDIRDNSVRVVSAIANSPADKAGLQSGDIINQINGQTITGLNLSEINQLFDGEEGTTVQLLVQRDAQIFPVTLTREIIHTDSVNVKMLSPTIAYAAISQFQEDTADNLSKALQALLIKFPVHGVLLDLRNNPGGLFDSAVDSADLFLNSGKIVSVHARNPDDNESYTANPGDILQHLPMVVLVNNGTASAAEILTAALQDNHRAIVVGQQTFGKGSVQTVIPLYHGGAVKLTTARYYTPDGKSIQARGITPQVILPDIQLQNADDEDNDDNTTEANLNNHLANPDSSKTSAPATPDNELLATRDFTLYEALNVLKTMQIVAHVPVTQKAPPKKAP